MVLIYSVPVLLIGGLLFLIFYGALPLLAKALSILEWIIFIVAVLGAIFIPIVIVSEFRNKANSMRDKLQTLVVGLIPLAICGFVLLADLGPVVQHILDKRMEYTNLEVYEISNVDTEVPVTDIPIVGNNVLAKIYWDKELYGREDGRIIFYTGQEFREMRWITKCDTESEWFASKEVPIEFYVHLYENSYKETESRVSIKITNSDGVEVSDLKWSFELPIEGAEYIEFEFINVCTNEDIVFVR